MNYRDMWYELKAKMVQDANTDDYYKKYYGQDMLGDMSKIELEEYKHEQNEH